MSTTSHRPGLLTGLGALLGLAVRRSRWFYLTWVLALASVVPLTATAYETIVDPGNAPLLIRTMENNPSMRALLGPPTDLTTPGGFTVWRVGTFTVVMGAVMAILGVVRSTRAEEEDGRTELLRSAAVGRYTPLVAGVLAALLACLALAVLITAGMVAVGEPLAGSMALGLGTGLVGAVFAGVAAVSAQLSSSARGARALALWTLAAAYTVRAMADGASTQGPLHRLGWGSPVQWMALARPYADERWWVLLLPLTAAVLLVAAAVVLESRRDHAAGLWPSRRGRATAPASLSSPLGLSWRLLRGSLLGWTIGMVLFALAMGSISTGFGDVLEGTPQLALIFERLGGGARQLSEAFYVALLSLVAIVMGILAVQLLHRLEAEERGGQVELVLSTAVQRTRLLGSYLLWATVVPVALLTLAAVLMTLNQAATEDDWGWPVRVAAGAVALAPGGLLLLGLAVFLHGWAPRLSWLVWAVVGWSLFVVWVGAVLGLPAWVTRLTPWAPLPQLPAEQMNWLAVLATTAVAAALALAGVVGYRRRDLGSG
ncbi:ABC transporter permease [Ornithinimicrobium pratense]|uniref:ABC transporter permease n=1 Tax=Ornithinimicrobium pratense TaxID=2593973 RepID=A0A5J6V6K8_9MICO|nr:ABC transporter permease [Ornithinimicrobium pratense]QFG69418.1 ABC transporter permease [Ornithinimicrobium pratense]